MEDSDRRRYEKEKKAKKLENEDLNTYVALRERGFTEDQIEVAGPGGANADFFAQDGMRIWIIEVKGRNNWMSVDNLTSNHNVPAKQLGNKALAKKAQKLKGIVLSSEQAQSVTLATYVADSNDGYASLLLRVTQLDVQDALLAFTIVLDDDGDATITDFQALTLQAALNFILADKTQESSGLQLKEDWEDSPGDARSWLIQNPASAIDLSSAYTAARRNAAHQLTASVTLAKLKEDNHELRLVPVTKTLPPVPKEDK